MAQRRVAIYCRVSDPKQEQGLSLQDQERQCREYAEERGWRVVGVFSEKWDGEEIYRPKLRELHAAGKRGEADTVLVWKQDRLGRGQTAHEVVFYMCELNGLEPVCVLEPYGDSPEALMMRGMRGIVSGEEKRNIGLRTQGGRRARARAGKLIPGPRPLFGYKWKDLGPRKGQTKVAYEIDDDPMGPGLPSPAAVVRRIFAEIAAGRTLGQVTAGLNADGIPTVMRRGPWLSSAIASIAKHPYYLGDAVAFGEQRWARVKVEGRSVYRRTCRSEDERVPLPPGTVPPLVSLAIAAAVRERLARNKAQARRNNAHPEAYLVRGFVFCGTCGHVAQAIMQTRKAEYAQPPRPVYRVTPQRSRGEHVDCPQASIAAPRLDEAVWARVREVFLDDDLIARALARLRHESDPTADRRAGVAKALEDVRKQRAGLIKVGGLVRDPDAAQQVAGQLDWLARRQRELEDEREALKAERSAWRYRQDALEQLAAWRATVAANLDTMPFEARRDLLVGLGATVELFPVKHEPRFRITLGLPLDEPGDGFVNRSTR